MCASVHGFTSEYVLNRFMACRKLTFWYDQRCVLYHIEVFCGLDVLMQSKFVLLKHDFAQIVFVDVSCRSRIASC